MSIYNLYTDALEKRAKVTARKTGTTAALAGALYGGVGAYKGAKNPGTKKDGTARSSTAGALRQGAGHALLGAGLGGAAQALHDSDKVRAGAKQLADKLPKTRGMKARALKKQRKHDAATFAHFGNPETGELSDYGQNLAALGALPRNAARMARKISPLGRHIASNS